MSRLIYGLLALALVSLVAGFVTRTSTVPLYASIALSGIVTILILAGISRRLRREGAFDDEPPAIESLDEDEHEDEDVERAATTLTIARVRAERDDDDDEDEDEDEDEIEAFADHDDRTEIVVEPPPPSRPARAKAPRAPADRPAPERAAKRSPPKPAAVNVLVIEGRPRYHRRSCRFTKGKDTEEMTVQTAKRRGYSPCSVCAP